MKKYIVILSCLLVPLFLASTAFAYNIDGNLSDWGVIPFSDWTPDSASAAWSGNQNWTGPGAYPNGGEKYDAEAMYFDSDSTNLYIALIVSMGQNGYWYNSHHLLPGDIGIDLTPATSDGHPYEFGFGITNFTGHLMAVDDWDLPDGDVGFLGNAPSTIVSGTDLGTGTLVYYDAGKLEGDDEPNTYIIEASIPKNLFGIPFNGQSIDLYWTMTCGNDTLSVSGSVLDYDDGGSGTIPEPGTVVLLLSGLLGVAGYRNR